jgi:hypothetical protein
MMVTQNRRSIDEGNKSRGWVLVKNISLEGIISLALAIVSAVYVFAFFQADVRTNARDNDSIRDMVIHHISGDAEAKDKTEEKLNKILEELGEIRGELRTKRNQQ